MLELKQTETFRKWWRKLRDTKARALVAARLDRLAYGLGAIISRSVMVSLSCGFITDPVIASTISATASRLLFCCVAAIRGRKTEI